MHAYVHPQGERMRVLVRVPLDLLLNINLPKRGNGYLDLSQVDEAFPRALSALAKDFQFLEGGRPLQMTHGEARIALPSDTSFQSYEQALASFARSPLPSSADVFWNQGYFDALLEYPIGSTAGSLEVDFHISPGLGDRLKLDLHYVMPDGSTRAFELATAQGPVPLDPNSYQAARAFVVSGVEHILGGVDHLLFLLCLVLPFRKLGWTLVGVVTAFTLAHSVTLIAAALGFVPSGDWFAPLVETLIAVSILYMAIENILKPQLQYRWLITALFGLVHGFGFSFSLANELQFAGSHLLLSLLAFNVGIEIGQLLALGAMWFPLAWLLRHAPAGERVVVAVVSAIAGHTAWHWMTERWEALSNASWPEIDVAMLLQAAFVAAALVALFLALQMMVQRGGPPGRPWRRR